MIMQDRTVPERLQKYLADAGLGSRRVIETWISEGRVKVNGRTAVLGTKVRGTERIMVDGRIIRRAPGSARRRPRVLIYHKPVGEVCTRVDPEGRRTVFEALPKVAGGRWIGVGRLDVDSAGLLLFTTDGALAHALMHPSAALPREYAVRVRGQPSGEELRRLTSGVELDDGPGRFDSLEAAGGEGSNAWYRVTVSEGRNRLVRRLWEAVGCQVSRLIRVRYGPVALPRHLPRGRCRELDRGALAELYQAADLPVAGADAPDRRQTKVIKNKTEHRGKRT